MKAEIEFNEIFNKICSKRLTLQSIIDKKRLECDYADDNTGLFELLEVLDALNQSLRIYILDMYSFAHSYIVNNEKQKARGDYAI